MLRVPALSGMERYALLLAIALAAVLRLGDFTAPWIADQTAWSGALYGNIARNFLVYGYVGTGFGPVGNFGLVDPAQFDYYYHYPPLLVWLVSLSFHLFGVSEWSARLVPLSFSLIAVPLTFDLGRRLTGDVRVATLAAFLIAAMPACAWYGTHVDVYGAPAVTLTLLAFWGYIRWLESRSTGSLFLMCSGVLLGCMTAWYTYFAALLILVHNWWFEDRAKRFPLGLAVAVAALPIIVFGSFLAHRWWLGVGAHNELHGTLWQKLLIRTSYADLPKPLWVVWANHVRATAALYTPLAVTLSGVGLLRVLIGSRWQRPDSASWLLLALLGYGVLHNLVFPGFLVNHNYMAVAYAFGLAITAAIGLFAVTDWVAMKSGHGTARLLAVAGSIVLVTAAITSSWRASRVDSEGGARVKSLGEAIRMSSGEREEVVVPVPEDWVLQYYAQREMVFGVSAPSALAALPTPTYGRVFVAAPKWLDDRPALRTYLEQRYPRRTQLPVVAYDLTSAADGPMPTNKALPEDQHD